MPDDPALQRVLDLLAPMADAYDRYRSEKTPGRDGFRARQAAWVQFTAAAELVADAEYARRTPAQPSGERRQ